MKLGQKPRGQVLNNSMFRILLSLLALQSVFAAAPLREGAREALDHIQPNSLKAHVSFLASDVLEGRNTPSRGLDVAAEFVAAQFRRAGLGPAGDDGYFQTVRMGVLRQSKEPPAITFHHGATSLTIPAEQATIRTNMGVQVDLKGARKLESGELKKLKPADVEGKVLLLKWASGLSAGLRRLREMRPALIVLSGKPPTLSAQTLVDLSAAKPAPVVWIDSKEFRELFDSLPADASHLRTEARLHNPTQEPVTLRNIVGILRGSDPALRDSYVLLSAHYDHIGVADKGDGDRIYNGANDDASGTASLIETAVALNKLPQRPKRSIIFLALFGEELGLIGSKHYAEHPVFPLDKTIAGLNLEQTGRTDDSAGPVLKRLRMTGEDFSNVLDTLVAAGKETGVQIDREPKVSAEFFNRSDNLSFARKGVPAHTVSVSYMFPDYHGLADHWEKIDYDNLALVTRTIAAAALMLADSTEVPQWNRDNPLTREYAPKPAQ